MRILLSNDDGFFAPGIKRLEEQLSSHEIWVVAPEVERSATGHTLTLDHPLRVNEVSERHFTCSGFPADCSFVALSHVMKNHKPDLVVSGINRGANLAQDIYYSGTVAAAREATLHGVPSIAVSLVFKDFKDTPHYETAARFVNELIKQGIDRLIPPYHVININVPNLSWSEIRGCSRSVLGLRKYSNQIVARSDARGKEYLWIAGAYQGFQQIEGSDCQIIEKDFISISFLSLMDAAKTDYNQMDDLISSLNKKLFN